MQCHFFKFFPELLKYPDIVAIILSSSRSPTPASPHLNTPSGVQPGPSTWLAALQPSTGKMHMLSSMQQPPTTQPPPLSYASGLLDKKKLHKKGLPCTGPSCRRAYALCCVCGKCLKHCTDDGGCPIHSAGSSDQECLDKDGHVFTQVDDELLSDADPACGE